MAGGGVPDPEYVTARRVLLAALDALGPHRKAVVLVGAQAIYLRAGEIDLAVAPHTTDGDLAIDPRRLEDEPDLAATLRAAGFELAVRPGTWTLAATGVCIDFLVPAALGGSGRRGARLGPHGSEVARKVTGLEAAVVDHSLLRIEALEPGDIRAFDLAVAGTAALLVAKLHKIGERRNDTSRLQDKDALDVLRILRHGTPGELAASLARLATDTLAASVTRAARELLAELFAQRDAAGSIMAARSSAGLVDEEQIAISCEVLASDLLSRWR